MRRADAWRATYACHSDMLPALVVVTVAPARRQLSSRELAAQLFGSNLPAPTLASFRGSENAPRYRPSRSGQARHLAQTEAPKADDDDGMDIDDDDGASYIKASPSQPLSLACFAHTFYLSRDDMADKFPRCYDVEEAGK